MSTKEVIIHNMDLVEFARAAVMQKKAGQRLERVFLSIVKVCEHRKQEETIGFEGNEWFKCEHEGHPTAHSIYPSCSIENCPHGT